jgi:hypothetical protein
MPETAARNPVKVRRSLALRKRASGSAAIVGISAKCGSI